MFSLLLKTFCSKNDIVCSLHYANYDAQIIAECGCVSNGMQFSQQQLKRTNYRMCGNQTANNGKFPTSPHRCFVVTASLLMAVYRDCIALNVVSLISASADPPNGYSFKKVCLYV